MNTEDGTEGSQPQISSKPVMKRRTLVLSNGNAYGSKNKSPYLSKLDMKKLVEFTTRKEPQKVRRSKKKKRETMIQKLSRLMKPMNEDGFIRNQDEKKSSYY